MKTRSLYKAERMSLDRISTLPEPILDTILCLLPSVEAARTSVLSTEWRYKWTKIHKLNFIMGKRTYKLTSDIANLTERMNMHDVHQVLLRRQAPIDELTLWMKSYGEHYDYAEFDQIILHLSRNHTVKKLTLFGSLDDWCDLPISVFSLHHLTFLHLSNFDLDYLCKVDLDHPPIFIGFGSLKSLDLSDVKICTKTLLHLLSNCPALKRLSLHINESNDIDKPDGKCTINELFKCLPVIEHLTMTATDDGFQWLVLDLVPQELPTSLIHLKYLNLNGLCVVEDYESAFVHLLIRCSPSLERLELEIEWDLSVYKEYYRDVWLEHLNELRIDFSLNSAMKFLKFILARSPKLKKVTLEMIISVNQEVELEMLKTLERAPRASPAVTIDISRYDSSHLCHLLRS